MEFLSCLGKLTYWPRSGQKQICQSCRIWKLWCRNPRRLSWNRQTFSRGHFAGSLWPGGLGQLLTSLVFIWDDLHSTPGSVPGSALRSHRWRPGWYPQRSEHWPLHPQSVFSWPPRPNQGLGTGFFVVVFVVVSVALASSPLSALRSERDLKIY